MPKPTRCLQTNVTSHRYIIIITHIRRRISTTDILFYVRYYYYYYFSSSSHSVVQTIKTPMYVPAHIPASYTTPPVQGIQFDFQKAFPTDLRCIREHHDIYHPLYAHIYNPKLPPQRHRKPISAVSINNTAYFATHALSIYLWIITRNIIIIIIIYAFSGVHDIY